MCVCVCGRAGGRERQKGCLYSHVSGGKFYFEKIIAIFSMGQNYYMYVEKLPYLSSDEADVYTYLHASENSVMQLISTTLEKMLLKYAAFRGRTFFGRLI